MSNRTPPTSPTSSTKVGDVTFGYQGMELEGSRGHRTVSYYAEPGTSEYDAMLLLDSSSTTGANASKYGSSTVR